MLLEKGQLVLGKEYRIEQLIGVGVFTQVYRATHVDLLGSRALKVLHLGSPGIGDAQAEAYHRRFQVQAELARHLRHPNLIHVEDWRQEGELLILVMELATGPSLAGLIEKARRSGQPIPVAQVIATATDVGAGLAAIHNRHLVHGHVKPSNVLLDATGSAKLTDMGTSPGTQGRGEVPPAQSLASNPEHMSLPGDRSASGDMHDLGVTLFETLTGVVPAAGPRGRRVRTLRADVPEWLDELVALLLAASPDNHPRNGAEFLDLLSLGRQAEAQAQSRIQEQARREQEQLEQAEAERVRLEMAERARQEAEAQAKLQQEKEAEASARREAEEAERAAEEQARKQAEDLARLEAQTKREQEERKQQEIDRLRRLAAAEARRAAEERARLEAQEKARREEQERQEALALELKRQAEERARQEAEERARQEAEQAKRAAEEKARKEAEDLARLEAQAKREAEQRAREEAARLKREADEKARREREEAARLKREAEDKARHEREEAERLKRQEAERLKREADEKARREKAEQKQAQALQAKREAEERARLKAEEEARRKEEREKQAEAERVKREAEKAAKRAAEERALREKEQLKQAKLEKAKREAEEQARYDEELRKQAEAVRAQRDAERRAAAEELKRLDAERAAALAAEFLGASQGARRDPQERETRKQDKPHDDAQVKPGSQEEAVKTESKPVQPEAEKLPAEKQPEPPEPPAKVAFPLVERQENALTLTLAPDVTIRLFLVPEGEFLMGSDPGKDRDARPDELPQRRVYLDRFWMAEHPVTNEQYLAFVQATGYRESVPGDPARPDHPRVRVNWHDALMFCRWLSQVTQQTIRLPAEAEWEKAARGTNGRIYPWGDTPPALELCNYGNLIGDTTPVGKYRPLGTSPYGCADMAGNVWEWCADWYDPNYYQSAPNRNPLGPKRGECRVLRGGAFEDRANFLRCAARSWTDRATRAEDIGFRICLVSAEL